MQFTNRCYLFLFCVILLEVGILFFCLGFFPQRLPLQGNNSIQDIPQDLLTGAKELPKPKFGAIILMVIDALRADFLFGDSGTYFEFTSSLVKQGKTFSYIAQAQSPTVTLPRIKALMSGGIPSFMDFLFNFKSQELTDDSLIFQFSQNGRKINFFGDDTWLKLFPKYFTEYEGTTSFFVADTVECDQNVTRHLDSQFSSLNWDVLILHYLGLDHVGHSGGPNSLLMAPKQKEMDEIIKKIHEKITEIDAKRSLPTLFILCSDHGMNELGNHGGSSSGETSATLVFMSSAFQNNTGNVHVDTTLQVDLVPTLSLLFGTPIPRNSLGVLISDLFSDRPDEWLRALQINSHQQLEMVKANPFFWRENNPANSKIQKLYDFLIEAQTLHLKYLQSKGSKKELKEESIDLYMKFLKGIQSEWARQLSSHDMQFIGVGISLMLISCILFFFNLSNFTLFSYLKKINKEGIFHFFIDANTSERSLLGVKGFLIIGTIIHLASLSSSSSVEEEHQTWYFFSTTVYLLVCAHLFIQRKHSEASCMILVALIHRIVRAWNQTGPDYAKWLLYPGREYILYSLVFSSILLVTIYAVYLANSQKRTLLFPIFCILKALFVIMYKFQITLGIPSLYLARAAYLSFFGMIFSLIGNHGVFTKLVIAAFSLLFMLLHKLHNIPVIALLFCQILLYSTVSKLLPNWINYMILMWAGKSAFFAFGNSNSLATIDISGAYTGLSDYNEIFVGLLTGLIGLTGPLMFFFASFLVPKEPQNAYLTSALLGVGLHSLEISLFSIITTHLRHHLFIWSVFSPKYIYELFFNLFEIAKSFGYLLAASK